MKTGVFLIILAVALALDGLIRIVLGIMGGNIVLVIGGLLTGVGLGGFSLHYGIKKIKESKESNDKYRSN